MHLFTIALLGSLINYIINTTKCLLGKDYYKSFNTILKGEGNEKASVFDYDGKNTTTGYYLIIGVVIWNVIWNY